MQIKNFHTTQDLDKNLDQVLSEFKNTVLNDLDFKQAKILVYWLNDWNEKFLKNENSFDPLKLIKYKRGNIVKAHLGYNIGSEQGGLHYGLVLDKDNDKNSPVLTIIPLRSLKDNESAEDINTNFEIYLGEALITDKIEYVQGKIEDLKNKSKSLSQTDSNYIKYSKRIRRYEKELRNLQKGSIAIVSQIRTVSKMRIFEPIKSYHSLRKFELDKKKLNDIDNMIKTLFIGE